MGKLIQLPLNCFSRLLATKKGLNYAKSVRSWRKMINHHYCIICAANFSAQHSRTSAHPASKREGNNANGCEDFCLENSASQGQNLALTVLFVPNSLDSGYRW